MADRLIETSNTSGFRQLGLHGQAVVTAHRQLAAILGSRLSADHAAFLALPRLDPSGQQVDWYTALDGAVQRISDLPLDAAAALRAAAHARSAEIAALAQSLTATDGAGALVGRMLTFALTAPGPEFLYSVGGKPVQILWGHQSETGLTLESEPPLSLPEAPVASLVGYKRPGLEPQPATPASASSVQSGSQPDPQAPETEAFAADAGGATEPVRRSFWGWLLWLLPLLLLLLILLLAFKACTPLEPRVVDVLDPAPPALPSDPTADLSARVKALQAERDRLAEERKATIAQCVPDDPIPPKRVEDLPAAPKPPTPKPPTPKPPAPETPAVRPSAPPVPTPVSPLTAPAIPTPQPPKAAEAAPNCKGSGDDRRWVGKHE